MKTIIVTNLPNPHQMIVLRVSDDNFSKALEITKKAVVDIKYDENYDPGDYDLAWQIDGVIYKMFNKHGIKYERHSEVPVRSVHESDVLLDEYWIYFDQINKEGEQ